MTTESQNLGLTSHAELFLFAGTNLKGESFTDQSSFWQTTNTMREILHDPTFAFMFWDNQ